MKKPLIIILVVLTVLILCLFVCCSILGNMNHVEIEKTNAALGISEEIKIVNEEYTVLPQNEVRHDIVNIALFGVDKEKSGSNSRSDSIMILTVDFINKKIKLSSLMRDMYVEIDGHGSTKLNHAYAYGGAPLAIKTINQNFGTNIRDYAKVNYIMFEKIIDIFGGVSIDVKQEEIPYINKNSRWDEIITKAGEQLLNGNQAVSYARIRYIGNGDFERTQRQRLVLSLIMEKAKEKGIAAVPDLVSEILPLVETSLDKQTILTLALDYFKAGEMTFDQERFPVDGYYWNNMTDGIYYLKFDSEKTKQQIMDYVYNDIIPIAKN